MSNKAPRVAGDRGEQPWFTARREKNRKKDRAAKAARRKNRG